MGNELIESKIGPSWCKVDVGKLLRKLRIPQSPADDGVSIVAQRFRKLFAGHELKLQHAIDIFPLEFGLTLDKLSSDEKILGFLTPQVLDWTAAYFGIRRDWLDGSVPHICGEKIVQMKIQES
ncbi:MAG: hypothetical protein RRC34_01575 [Lentisphaeria bacterium]|nr:hypothetical protein [Lentisphaeria bacterium]